MKKIISLIFITISFFATAQISYTYDNAGNRKTRELYVCPTCRTMAAAKQETPPKEELQQAAQVAMQHGVSVYPNPVTDVINVTVSGVANGESATVYIIDGTGRVLDSKKGATSPTAFDLKSYSPGIYFVKVSAGKDELFYRVVKTE